MIKKTILSILIAVAIILVAVVTLRFLSGYEDTWICDNGAWVRHGNPSKPMPTSGCGSEDVKKEETNILPGTQQTDEKNSVGIANPASVYCVEQKGKLEIRKDSVGNEAGWCIFANGEECEEWSFFRGECSAQYLNKDENENIKG
jgi:putative hemolysin